MSIEDTTGLVSLSYKLRSVISLEEDDKRNAIYYQTRSLGASKLQKFSETARQSTDLDDLMEKLVKSAPKSRTDGPGLDHDGYADLCSRCAELPDEWTVLQVAKEFTPLATSMVHEELLHATTPIWLTVFRCSEACEGSSCEPILLVLDPPCDLPSCKYPNFFEHASSLPSEVRNAIANTESTSGGNQASRLEDVEQLIISAVYRIKDWLGPWVNLFLGKPRSTAEQKLENEIYTEIELFCVSNNINRRIQRLVSLVARRLDLLQDIHLYELCTSEQIGLESEKSDALYSLLYDLKRQKFSKAIEEQLDRFPVVLVVDDLLDSVPWEMIYPTGELSRVSSFWTLSELYRVHAKRIKNGYLSISANDCFSIINPDRNLAKMSTRLQLFYKEWFPNFRLLIDQPPTEAEFSEVLNKSDVLIYNGHGSGLQFMNGFSLLRRDINCVTFLFGCDSVRMYSNGLFTEMTGTHMYYNAARCPTVVGSLWVLTDLYTDIYSMLLVGSWIPSTNPSYAKTNIASLDTAAFKAGKLQFQKNSSTTRLVVRRHANLLKLMADCRMFHHLPQRIRSALVCRGLPVVNEACI